MKKVAGLSLSLVFLLGTFSATADGALYWAEVDIGRVNTDGSLLTPGFIATGSGSTCGIAVNESHLYWTDSYTDSIGRAGLDGTNIEDEFIAPAGGVPCGIAADSHYLYWANLGGESLGRAKLDGSQVEPAFISAPQDPCGVAVNATHLYWSSESEGVIRRSDLGGMNEPEVVVAGADAPCGIAVNNEHLFWASSNSGMIGRANLNGSNAILDFIVGGEFPASVVLGKDYIYWVNAGWDFESIARARLDGTDVIQRFLTLRHPYALALDDIKILPTVEPPPEISSFSIGQVKRNRRSGVLHVAVDLPVHGVLRAVVTGKKAKVAPVVLKNGRALDAGRAWLKVIPRSRRIRRCGRKRSIRFRTTLYLGFEEYGKGQAVRSRRLRLRMAPRVCKKRISSHHRPAPRKPKAPKTNVSWLYF